MSPDYLYTLADLADPQQLWKRSGLEQLEFTEQQQFQLDTGVALRRYAAYQEDLRRALAQGKSVLVSPFTNSSYAVKLVDMPEDHLATKRKVAP